MRYRQVELRHENSTDKSVYWLEENFEKRLERGSVIFVAEESMMDPLQVTQLFTTVRGKRDVPPQGRVSEWYFVEA